MKWSQAESSSEGERRGQLPRAQARKTKNLLRWSLIRKNNFSLFSSPGRLWHLKKPVRTLSLPKIACGRWVRSQPNMMGEEPWTWLGWQLSFPKPSEGNRLSLPWVAFPKLTQGPCIFYSKWVSGTVPFISTSPGWCPVRHTSPELWDRQKQELPSHSHQSEGYQGMQPLTLVIWDISGGVLSDM